MGFLLDARLLALLNFFLYVISLDALHYKN